MEVVFFGIGLAVGGIAAWFLGLRTGARTVLKPLAGLANSLKAGNLPSPDRMTANEIRELTEIRKTLSEDWVRRAEAEGDDARKAMARIARYLRRRVEAPLLEGLDGDRDNLRVGAEEALGAVEDLEFFLEDPPRARPPESVSLGDLVTDVTREFAEQSSVLVKVEAPNQPIHVQVEPEPVKDAIFLILHNASEFGNDRPILITLSTEAGFGSIRVSDQGPGFTPESLLKAMDPFFSTAEDSLGLGLPHARRAVNAQGGDVFLRNPDEGGAEVEVRLPLRG